MAATRTGAGQPIPVNTIGRLGLYRRLLDELAQGPTLQIYSHQLAAIADRTPTQVRRDLMTIGFSGSPRVGYDVLQLLAAIDGVLARAIDSRAGLVGIGNLGCAILAYYSSRQPMRFAAAFDRDPEKVGRLVRGCPCYPMQDLADVVARDGIRVGVIAVPPSEAQGAADRLVLAGVRGILNFAPGRLHVPNGLYIENIDMTTVLDRVAFHARRSSR